MWLEYETALRALIAGVDIAAVIPGEPATSAAAIIPYAPVHGTDDAPILDETSETWVQVCYLGYSVEAQAHARTAAFIDLIYVIRLGAAPAKIDPDILRQLDAGLLLAITRLLAFAAGAAAAPIRPRLIDPPPPQWQGAAGEMAIYLTLRKPLTGASDHGR
jgi:hypothetical protein